MRALFFAWLLSSATCSCLGQTLHQIKPSNTDAGISNSYGDHYTYFNSQVGSKQKLVVFFPGTGAIPQYYQDFLKNASNLGFHTIGLAYPNSTTIGSICAANSDTNCYGNTRLEVIDGQDRSSAIDVNRANCIENRLIKVLKFLNTNFPNEAWGQYLQNDSIILWPNIVVIGHSQGGGHAGVIGKTRKVDRVIFLSSADYMNNQKRTPAWVTQKSMTPENHFFALAHIKDEVIPIATHRIFWNDLHLTSIASEKNIDNTGINFGPGRVFSTNATPATLATQYHNAVAVSLYTPKDSLGNPLYAPIWQYMLTTTSNTNDIQTLDEREKVKMSVYPNPFNERFSLQADIDAVDYFQIASIDGKIIETIQQKNNSFNLSNDLPKGIYFLCAFDKEKKMIAVEKLVSY